MINIKVDSTRDIERRGYECTTEMDCNIRGRLRAVAELKAVLKALENVDRVALAIAVTEIIAENEEGDEDDD